VQRLGAIAIGNSGYLLPNDSTNQERYEWLAATVRKYGGEVSVLRIESIDNISFAQLAERFTDARTDSYKALIRHLLKYIATPPDRRPPIQSLRLRNRFEEIVAMDFFENPLRRRAEELIERMEERDAKSRSETEETRLRIRDFSRTTWVTRPRPGIDRCASAWLIRNFVDKKARFVFASEEQKPKGAVAFDMYKGRFGHRGDDCTFETLEKVFHIRDSRVRAIGQMVHDADLFDNKFGRKEGYGIDAVMKGWGCQRSLTDKELIERGISLVDGVYRSLS
jgi:hypothetical protein